MMVILLSSKEIAINLAGQALSKSIGRPIDLAIIACPATSLLLYKSLERPGNYCTIGVASLLLVIILSL